MGEAAPLPGSPALWAACGQSPGLQAAGVWGTLARLGVCTGPEQGGGPNTQSPLTGHWPVRTGTGGACEMARIMLCPQAPIQARSPDPGQPHLRALTDSRATGPPLGGGHRP